MSERDAFMRAIIDDPAGDVVRLVFADWFEENGATERAEFIRTQLATPGRVVYLRRGERCRWRGHRPAAVTILVNAVFDRVAINRGFIEAVECDLPTWLKHGPAFAREHPITRVSAAGPEPFEYPATDPADRWWSWIRRTSADVNHGAAVPDLVFEFLRDGTLVKDSRRYPTHEAACADLSVALAEWAKADGEPQRGTTG